VASARLLAKELVRTRKATTQLYTNKAHMIAMGTQLQEQLAMVKVPTLLLVCCEHWHDRRMLALADSANAADMSMHACAPSDWRACLACLQVAGTLSKSTEVMKLVNDMMRVRELPAFTRHSLPGFHTLGCSTC
jgi:hypothetical protein